MILKLYVPTDVADTRDVANKTVLTVLKERAADHYDGFTTYDATGGWVDGDGNLIEEKVTVLEIVIDESAELDAKHYGKVNARWITYATDETAVMYTIDGVKFMEYADEV